LYDYRAEGWQTSRAPSLDFPSSGEPFFGPPDLTWSYANDGQVTQLSDTSGTSKYAYDKDNNLVLSTQSRPPRRGSPTPSPIRTRTSTSSCAAPRHAAASPAAATPPKPTTSTATSKPAQTTAPSTPPASTPAGEAVSSPTTGSTKSPTKP